MSHNLRKLIKNFKSKPWSKTSHIFISDYNHLFVLLLHYLVCSLHYDYVADMLEIFITRNKEQKIGYLHLFVY